jgi:Na+/melibiose symporter-like transporter
MVADVADEDALTHGTRREGLFFGILNLGEKLAAGLALLIGGALLQYFIKLPAGAAPDAIGAARIGVAFGIIPAVILCAATVPLLTYTLTRQRVERIQRVLADMPANRLDPVPGPAESEPVFHELERAR